VKRVSVALCVALALSAVMCAQSATSKEPLKAEMTASKIVLRDSVETREPANVVKPGDLVEYAVVYKNQSNRALKDVRGTLPVPAGMSYVSETAVPAGAWASTNGTDFAPLPLKRKEKSASGAEAEVLVPAREYRALRWDLGEIAAGASKTVRARVRVENSSSAASATSSK
jgi:uncharacterized repeat protein (TIGR01451 family)